MPLITIQGTDNAVNTAYLPLMTVLVPVHCSAQQWYNTTYRGQCHATQTVLPALDCSHNTGTLVRDGCLPDFTDIKLKYQPSDALVLYLLSNGA